MRFESLLNRQERGEITQADAAELLEWRFASEPPTRPPTAPVTRRDPRAGPIKIKCMPRHLQLSTPRYCEDAPTMVSAATGGNGDP